MKFKKIDILKNILNILFLFVFLRCTEDFQLNPRNNPYDPHGDNWLYTIVTEVTDIEGNVYQAIKLGNQVWTVENLRTTKYNDGTEIPNVTSNSSWNNTNEGSYCNYNNTTNVDSIKKFGALYNWYTIETGKLAPVGWHVPSDAEWRELENYLITSGYNWDGSTSGNKIAKSMATKEGWRAYFETGTIGNDTGSNNSSGFSALPGGFRGSDSKFYDIGSKAFFWSTSKDYGSYIYYRCLSYSWSLIHSNGFSKKCGLSVRLVMDI